MAIEITWDYSKLAQYYEKRPLYNSSVILRFLRRAGLKPGMKACDIGAGTGNLTILLLEYGLQVTAIEPESRMSEIGINKTSRFSDIAWIKKCGEDTGQPGNEFDLVTFGSSFNVVNRELALAETGRILKPGGWLGCLWNHRDLGDDLQCRIEQTILKNLPDYRYGVRRQDQTGVLEKTRLFQGVWRMDSPIIHRLNTTDIVEAWKSHATLKRQAGDKFTSIIDQIRDLLESTGESIHEIPYRTRLWVARLKS